MNDDNTIPLWRRVVQDAIEQVKQGHFRATRGYWIEGLNDLNPSYVKERDLTRVSAQIPEHCKVCALGSLLLSRARIDPELTMGALYKGRIEKHLTVPNNPDQVDAKEVQAALSSLFDPQTLLLVELAYELGDGEHDVDINNPEHVATVAFGVRYRTATSRILAVLNNLLDNEGKFIVPALDSEEYDEVLYMLKERCFDVDDDSEDYSDDDDFDDLDGDEVD